MFQKTDDGIEVEINIFDDGTVYLDIGPGEGVVGFTREQAAQLAKTLQLVKTLTHYVETGELP